MGVGYRRALAVVIAVAACAHPAAAAAHDPGTGASAHAGEHARQDRALVRLASRWQALQPARRRAERRRAGAVAQRAMQLSVDAPAEETGRWSRPEDRVPLPLYAINSVVMPTGKVLMWGRPPVDPGSGTRANTTPAYLWDPAHPSLPAQDVTPQLDLDGDGDLENAPVFCSGQSLLPDGRVLAAGGTLAHPDEQTGTSFKGLDLLFLFDPWTERWSIAGRMRHGRWYPSQVELADGRIAILAGLDETGSAADNRELELYDWRDGSITHAPAGDAMPSAFPYFTYYPHLFAMPGGDVLLGGSAGQSGLLDTGSLAAGGAPGSAWTAIGGGRPRGFGMGVHLPGAPTRAALVGGYGGDLGARRDADVIDVAAAAPRWAPSPEVPPLNVARSNGNVVILPDGTLASIGGGAGSSAPGVTAGGDPAVDPGTANAYTGRDQALKRVELLRPGADDAWRLGPAQAKWRTYHSTATLLPDGRVLSAGDDYWDIGDLPDPWAASGGAVDEGELYSPPYLFDGNEPAPRPVIGDAPGRARYGDVARLRLSAGDAARAVLVAPAAVTHSADMNQRHVELEIAGASGDSDRRAASGRRRARTARLLHAVRHRRRRDAVGRALDPARRPAGAGPVARRDRDARRRSRLRPRPAAGAT